MFIDGEWVDSLERRDRDLTSVLRRVRSVATVQDGTREDADTAVAAARKAYEEIWFDTTAEGTLAR